MKKIIKHQEICKACDGTGIYSGFAEGEGMGVVCYKCKGTGCYEYHHEYEPFKQRKNIDNIIHVIQHNPGIGCGEGSGYKLKDFGGMSYQEWKESGEFIIGSEMRKFTCPAWWYQSVDYQLKPRWKECICGGTFSSCSSFMNKESCWERWDKEFGINKS